MWLAIIILGGFEMYLYSHSNQKKPSKFKGFLTILLTVFITTVVIENILILMTPDNIKLYRYLK